MKSNQMDEVFQNTIEINMTNKTNKTTFDKVYHRAKLEGIVEYLEQFMEPYDTQVYELLNKTLELSTNLKKKDTIVVCDTVTRCPSTIKCDEGSRFEDLERLKIELTVHQNSKPEATDRTVAEYNSWRRGQTSGDNINKDELKYWNNQRRVILANGQWRETYDELTGLINEFETALSVPTDTLSNDVDSNNDTNIYCNTCEDMEINRDETELEQELVYMRVMFEFQNKINADLKKYQKELKELSI